MRNLRQHGTGASPPYPQASRPEGERAEGETDPRAADGRTETEDPGRLSALSREDPRRSNLVAAPRHRLLESRMTRKCHVRFGGGLTEKDQQWALAGSLAYHMGDLLRLVHEHPDAEIVGICHEDPARIGRVAP